MAIYVREKYERQVDQRVVEFLRDHSLALLISCTDVGPVMSHLPILVGGDHASVGRLRGHLAKANPHYNVLRNSPHCTMVFSGPNAYMSPKWYRPPFAQPSSKPSAPRFPTWNYLAVEISGNLQFASSDEEVDRVLDDTIEYFEQRNGTHWDPSSYPRERRAAMRSNVAAFELFPDKITPKFKLSQYYEPEEILGSVLGLYSKGTQPEALIARYMHETLLEGKSQQDV